MKPAIRVDNLSKQFRLGARGHRGYRTLRESLVDAVKAPLRAFAGRKREDAGDPVQPSTFWALDQVSFDIQQGEVVGLIGRNGAGKSTLLKVLSRITEPTHGRVELRGRVGSLLEVGTGFHPELTGRENIYLNGAILGMKREEITRKFDEIVAFAEMDQFLDTPVKRYSSGMYVRLAFAVAAHLELEILLVDEVLAVGDGPFQRKCLGKMGDVARSGRTVILVSHNMASLFNLCGKVVVIEKGKVRFSGDCREGIELYMQSCAGAGGGDVNLTEHPNRAPGNAPVLERVRFLNREGVVTDRINAGEPLTIELYANTRLPESQFNFHVGVDDSMGARLFTVATNLSTSGPVTVKEGTRRVTCRLDSLALAPGRYVLSFYVGPSYKPVMDTVEHAAWIEVLPEDYFGNGRFPGASEGRFLVRSTWETE